MQNDLVQDAFALLRRGEEDGARRRVTSVGTDKAPAPPVQSCLRVYGRLNERIAASERGVAHRESVPLREKFQVLPASKYWRIPLAYLVSRNVDNPAKWLSALTPRELWGTGLWRSFDGELRRHFKSRHVREALGSYAMYLGGSPYQLSGMFTILPYGEMAHGLWLPEGGVYGLVEGIERLARELGVEVRTRVTRPGVCGSKVGGPCCSRRS